MEQPWLLIFCVIILKKEKKISVNALFIRVFESIKFDYSTLCQKIIIVCKMKKKKNRMKEHTQNFKWIKTKCFFNHPINAEKIYIFYEFIGQKRWMVPKKNEKFWLEFIYISTVIYLRKYNSTTLWWYI